LNLSIALLEKRLQFFFRVVFDKKYQQISKSSRTAFFFLLVLVCRLLF
jgi:hypothetical protein